MAELHSIYATFIASMRSVGTACTMAAAGVYLHRRNFIIGEGKRTLALISQQVTIPAFLFTKIVYCNQDWSDKPCPDVTSKMGDIWVLLFWPAYVVGCGMIIGWFGAKIARTPRSQISSVMATCAFGNSTGLPITLLTVIHQNFPSTTELGRVDPTLFLSVYLLLYPVLQWGLGGWLLAPEEVSQQDGDDKDADDLAKESSDQQHAEHMKQALRRKSSTRNVLNNLNTSSWYKHSRRGMTETDASLYISNADLVGLGAAQGIEGTQELVATSPPTVFVSPPKPSDGGDGMHSPPPPASVLSVPAQPKNEQTPLIGPPDDVTSTVRSVSESTVAYEDNTVLETLSKIASRCLQPPVVGAILGLVVAATPLRGIFVDLVNRADAAPLEWFFDGLYAVGQAAVPINMIILGCNLSSSGLSNSSMKGKERDPRLLPRKTMMAIVIGKMVLMPCVGIASALILNKYVWDIPEDINASFYLVAMIVFITPTANNVMVMVELSGRGSKEGIAQVIGWQYAIAPVFLSLSVTAVVGIASRWS